MMKKVVGVMFVVVMLLVGMVYVDDVKIGYVGLMMGVQVYYGKDMQNGIVFVLEDFNVMNLKIGGKLVKFVLSMQDDQVDLCMGMMVVQKLVDDGIKGMFGYFNLGMMILVLCIYVNVGILEIVMVMVLEYMQ